jgi:hypothetical protein
MPQKKSDESHVVLYHTPDGKVTVNVVFARENFWLTQKAMTELFGVNKSAISKHLKNIYASGELTLAATVSKMETVQIEGGHQTSREIEFYNLDAVIAVGYRVNSIKATHFRIWATNTLREYIVKGFVLNDELLKNGRQFGEKERRTMNQHANAIAGHLNTPHPWQTLHRAMMLGAKYPCNPCNPWFTPFV